MSVCLTNNTLIGIGSLTREIKRRRESIEITPEMIEAREKIWGSPDIEIVASFSHQNLSCPSRNLVGYERLKIIAEELNMKCLSLVMELPDSEEERIEGGGPSILDFGPLGRFSCNEWPEKLISDRIKQILLPLGLEKPEKDIIAKSVLGRMEGIKKANYHFFQNKLGRSENIKETYVFKLPEIARESWKNKLQRWELFKKTGVIWYGNSYNPDLCKQLQFLPDSINSQAISFWQNGNGRLVDVSTLHLLKYSLMEYISIIKDRARIFSCEKPNIFEVKDILLEYL